MPKPDSGDWIEAVELWKRDPEAYYQYALERIREYREANELLTTVYNRAMESNGERARGPEMLQLEHIRRKLQGRIEYWVLSKNRGMPVEMAVAVQDVNRAMGIKR